MNTKQNYKNYRDDRRGSTLVIVIALLGLLAFTGVVFFTFASQERAAAEYFSESVKGEVDAPDNVWDHPLRQIISGTDNHPGDRPSILRSVKGRLSIVNNLVGSDLSPHSGEGVHLIMEDSGSGVIVPRVDMDWDGTANDEDGGAGEPDNQQLLNFVDSPAAWLGNETRTSIIPAADVDYTAPDINNLFLAYKGWAIRDNDPTGAAGINPRYERVPVIIPSFFRPQYMTTGGGNGFLGNPAPADINWASSFDGINRGTTSLDFSRRSFRPNPRHIAGMMPDGVTPVYRFLTAADATARGITSGGFPFVPADNPLTKPGGNNGVLGELGVWTGSEPEAYELDADPDGDGIREGIWIDTNYPVQEHVDGSGTTKLYVVLHSFTIYDLDGLIDLNTQGNLAGLDRSGNVQAIAGTGILNSLSVSRSNLGLGPNEINPIWALRRPFSTPFSDASAAQFLYHFGRLPSSALEQANMEWIWLMSGRAKIGSGVEDIYAGRWGEAERIFNTYGGSGTFNVWDLPRPGVSGNAQQSLSAGIRFGGSYATAGRNGFDDNQDAYDGEIAPSLGRIRPFGTPMDYSGIGRVFARPISGYNPATGTHNLPTNAVIDPRMPILSHDTGSTGPERFQAFNGYSLMRDINTSKPRYVYGENETFDSATGDDLIANPYLDPLFEDPLESVFDAEISQKNFDAVYGPQDLFALHLVAADILPPPNGPSLRLNQLAPFSLHNGNAPFSFLEGTTPGVRSRFTTITNSLHRFMMRSPFGSDGKPGIAGIDDNGDGTIDNLADLTDPATNFVWGVSDTDTLNRIWEFNADTDGNDANGDGFADGDGFYEFPPKFGPATTITNGLPYSGTDPFRPQVRRLLAMESGENRGLYGQMPISINHILDVERNNQTPADGTPEFLYYMQRAGMRFRPLIDHPSADEGATVTGATVIPTTSAGSPVLFPPTTPEQREFWARRDRQKLARDIYVLLYTIGGARIDSTTNRIVDYTVANDPSAAEGSSLYTHEQLRRMAQFAVNMVDAMDSDNVVTKFEYDKNLGPGAGGLAGWNMDDDPYAAMAANGALGYAEDVPSTTASVTDNGLYPEDGIERGVVYGIEAQELAFNEVLAATSQKFPMGYADSQQTKHTDMTDDTNFLQIEIQNVRPMSVPLAVTGVTGTGNEDRGIWQLARFDRDTAASTPQTIIPTKQLTFMEGNSSISGGDQFTIAMAGQSMSASAADPTGWGTADLYINEDSDAGMTYELIAPDVTAPSLTAGGAPAVPRCDLDLIYPAHVNRWLNAGNDRTKLGEFISTLKRSYGNDDFKPIAAGTTGFDLVLRRRANPNMPQLPLTENPWIEVDRHPVVFANMFQDDTTGMQMILHLEDAKSQERVEPLNAVSRVPYVMANDPAPLPYRYNTIGSEINSATNNGTFELMQPHYDREYSSAIELLQLPVVGPNLLTYRLNRMRYAPFQQVHDAPATLGGTLDPKNLASAEAMFLQPDFPYNSGKTLEQNTSRDNRWYRLFQFVEVPSRVHRMLGNYLTLQRIPGKLNINTIRHREVLAALIDNPWFADVPFLNDLTPAVGSGTSPGNSAEDAPFLRSHVPGDGRDAWLEFVKERDGRSVLSYHPTIGAGTYWLPSTAYATPFRSMGFQGGSSVVGNGASFKGGSAVADNGFEHSPLRRMLLDRDADGDGVDYDGIGYKLNQDFSSGVVSEVTIGVAGGGAQTVTNSNRQWLEVGSRALNRLPGDFNEDGTNEEHRFAAIPQRHQVLSKIMNNTTTVSNCFIVYGVAAYFEAYEDPTTGLIQVGGRYDLDADGDPANDEQRAVYIIDRTEAFNAYDPGSGSFDWKRLVKSQLTIK